MTRPARPEDAISVIERVAGTRPGFRRAHARGLVVRGSFQAGPEARALTIAEHMQGAPIPCLVRFSNASGNPCAPDSNSPTEGRVLGLAIRFELPSGKAATWAGINIPAFPSRTPEEFIRFTAAQAPGRGGKPNMLRIAWHVLKHLHILASIKGLKALRPTGSLAMETYRGIHTYYFVDADGVRKPFRYQWVPRLEKESLAPEKIRSLPGQYLLNEIRARLEKGPVSWDLVAQFPEAGDPLDDASVAWPTERKAITLGRLVVSRVHEDQKAKEGLVFDPTGVVPGIELSDDPLLKFRSLVYGVSFDKRSKEQRAEPAPADMAQ